MPDNVLMIAYHFSPCAEVSGALRTSSMANQLANTGYRPIILAPHPRAYPKLATTELMLAEGCEIKRAFALDAARHLGLAGRYPDFFAQPDRWVSWWLGAVPLGLALIYRHKPKVLWSTYPVATAHLIAATLHRLTGIPWIADFRDPMVLPTYPISRRTMSARTRLEKNVVRNAHTCVFVTGRSREFYSSRYRDSEHGPFEVIPNGFDEDSFAQFCPHTDSRVAFDRMGDRPMVLVHSGLLYRCGRDPGPFFAAISNLINNGTLPRNAVRIVLRASGNDEGYARTVSKYGLDDVVAILPMLERPAALAEQNSADGVLLFQGHEFNTQVPAKIYEYLRLGKPILALVDSEGETAELIRQENVGLVVDINDVTALEQGLLDFLAKARAGTFKSLCGASLHKYSRQKGAQQLVDLVESIVRT